MTDRGRQIEALAEAALTQLASNSERVSEAYEQFLRNVEAKTDQVSLESRECGFPSLTKHSWLNSAWQLQDMSINKQRYSAMHLEEKRNASGRS